MFERKLAAQPAVAARPGASLSTRLVVVSVLVVAAAATAVGVHAQGMGPGAGGHEGGMMMFGGGPEHMGRGIDHLLDGIGATDSQRDQIKQIAMAAAADMKAQREAGRGLHDKALNIFAAPNVDASAAESLRQQMMAQHDQASKRMLQAMLDASKVLTPEQRVKLAQRAHERELIMQERMQREMRDHPKAPK